MKYHFCPISNMNSVQNPQFLISFHLKHSSETLEKGYKDGRLKEPRSSLRSCQNIREHPLIQAQKDVILSCSKPIKFHCSTFKQLQPVFIVSLMLSAVSINEYHPL